MPLTQGRIVGHDNERLVFRFTMLNGDETVNCQISDAYHAAARDAGDRLELAARVLMLPPR
jgi:hypothetical protein